AGVEQWAVADPFRPDREPTPQYYPRPGKKNVSVHLGVIPVSGGPTVWVEWDRKKFEYLVDVTWQKYGPLTIHVQDRAQQRISFRRVDLKTGQTDQIGHNVEASFLN